jgi:hypothetical protein
MVLFEEVRIDGDMFTAKISIIDNEFDYKHVISKYVSGLLKVAIPEEIITDLDSSSTYIMVVVHEENGAAVILSKEK